MIHFNNRLADMWCSTLTQGPFTSKYYCCYSVVCLILSLSVAYPDCGTTNYKITSRSFPLAWWMVADFGKKSNFTLKIFAGTTIAQEILNGVLILLWKIFGLFYWSSQNWLKMHSPSSVIHINFENKCYWKFGILAINHACIYCALGYTILTKIKNLGAACDILEQHLPFLYHTVLNMVIARDLSTHLLDMLFQFWTPSNLEFYYWKDGNWTPHYHEKWHFGKPISKSWLKPWFLI